MDSLLTNFQLKEGDDPNIIKHKIRLLQLLCDEQEKTTHTMNHSHSMMSKEPNVQKLLEENRRLVKENELLKYKLSQLS